MGSGRLGPRRGTAEDRLLTVIGETPGLTYIELLRAIEQAPGGSAPRRLVGYGLAWKTLDARPRYYLTAAGLAWQRGAHRELPAPIPGDHQLRATSRIAAVLDAIVSEPGVLELRDIAEDLGVSAGAISTSVYKLRHLGLVKPDLPLRPTGQGVWAAHHHLR